MAMCPHVHLSLFQINVSNHSVDGYVFRLRCGLPLHQQETCMLVEHEQLCLIGYWQKILVESLYFGE